MAETLLAVDYEPLIRHAIVRAFPELTVKEADVHRHWVGSDGGALSVPCHRSDDGDDPHWRRGYATERLIVGTLEKKTTEKWEVKIL